MEQLSLALELERKLERVGKFLFWLPPVLGLIGMAIDKTPISALFLWFSAILVLFYKSGVYAKEGITRVEHEDYRERIMDIHLEMLHPGTWAVIAFVHVLIFALAILVASWFR